MRAVAGERQTRPRGLPLRQRRRDDSGQMGGVEMLPFGVLVLERGRFRIRERGVLRYYARSLEHLLHAPAGRTH